MAAIPDDDNNFQLDADGERVLVGLARSEMLEFIRLDELINANGPFPDILRDEWHSADEKRRLELWDKHEAARHLFLNAYKTRR
jgi:hypothetical protein